MIATIGAQLGQFFQRKRAEEALAATAAELKRRAAELERSNADLEQFAYVASHDLSEPLRMVSGFVQLLAQRYRGQLDSNADEFIDFTVEGVARMQDLIDDLLAFSRVGRDDSERTRVECDRLVRLALHPLAEQIEESGALVDVDELPAVHGRKAEIAQVFQNLLSNALKFRGDDPPRVRVLAEPDGDMWMFSVVDNGIGIESRHAERVFKMFQRLHARDAYPGTGIGLPICKKVVERHGGRIWVEPAPDGGAAFKFTLPAIAEEAP
jgi:light-regulated signal transduction histidine kinase (bacteriophytochrome)